MFTLSPVSLFPSIAFSTVLGPSHYSVKPHYIHYKQFQIQKLHVHLDDVDKKNYYIPRAYSARGYDVRALCVRHAVSQSRIWTFILLTGRIYSGRRHLPRTPSIGTTGNYFAYMI